LEGLGIDPQWCRWGFFSEATDRTMCPGVDSASNNEYQDSPGGKGGRCHLHSAESHGSPEALNFRIPKALLRPVVGQLTFTCTLMKREEGCGGYPCETTLPVSKTTTRMLNKTDNVRVT
jgi:hypothetical protein